MNLTIIGQKLESILQLCSQIKQKVSETPRHRQENGSNGQGKSERLPDYGDGEESHKQHPAFLLWEFLKTVGLPNFIQILLAAFTAAAVFISAKGYQKSIETYELINRPYVGVDTVDVRFRVPDGKGGYRTQTELTPEADGLVFSFFIKNFGSVPGSDVTADWDYRVDGVEIKRNQLPSGGDFIFPSQSDRFVGGIFGDDFRNVMSRKSVLEVQIKAGYGRGEKRYSYCIREQYVSVPGAFIRLGDVCSEPWHRGPTP